jgi:co-chaperonin GroES (HSP10)
LDSLAKKEKRAKVLAAVSRKLTKRSRRTAFSLGVGDMIAAERILDSTLKME